MGVLNHFNCKCAIKILKNNHHTSPVYNTLSAEGRRVPFGTGGISGGYYQTGSAIAGMVNKKKEEYGIDTTVESTGGSIFAMSSKI